MSEAADIACEIIDYGNTDFHSPKYHQHILEVVDKILKENKDRVIWIRIDANDGIRAKILREPFFDGRRVDSGN